MWETKVGGLDSQVESCPWKAEELRTEKPCGLRMGPGLGSPKFLDILTLLGHKKLGKDLGQGDEESGAGELSLSSVVVSPRNTEEPSARGLRLCSKVNKGFLHVPHVDS